MENTATTQLQRRIQSACDTTKPQSRQRMNALAEVRWVLRDESGHYAAAKGLLGGIETVPDIKDATGVAFDLHGILQLLTSTSSEYFLPL